MDRGPSESHLEYINRKTGRVFSKIEDAVDSEVVRFRNRRHTALKIAGLAVAFVLIGVILCAVW